MSVLIQADGAVGHSALTGLIGFVFNLTSVKSVFQVHCLHKAFQDVPLSVGLIIGFLSLWGFSGTKSLISFL